ncbi:MAG: hypothetical protein WD690_16640 [Vicinamibacterales bacterium]
MAHVSAMDAIIATGTYISRACRLCAGEAGVAYRFRAGSTVGISVPSCIRVCLSLSALTIFEARRDVDEGCKKAPLVISVRSVVWPDLVDVHPARRRSGPLSRRLKQLDRIAVWILDLDLFAARTRLDVIPKTDVGSLQGLDERWKMVDPKHDTIPSAGFLLVAIRHRPRSRCSWTAEQDPGVAERDAGKCGKLLVFEREAKMCRVERDRASDVLDLIPDAVHALNECVPSTALLLSGLGCFSRSRHLFFSCFFQIT